MNVQFLDPTSALLVLAVMRSTAQLFLTCMSGDSRLPWSCPNPNLPFFFPAALESLLLNLRNPRAVWDATSCQIISNVHGSNKSLDLEPHIFHVTSGSLPGYPLCLMSLSRRRNFQYVFLISYVRAL